MKKPVHSPWGAVQDAREIAPGIWTVSTASHGGFKLDKKRNELVPGYMRRGGGWYEEDVDWTHVVTAFPELFDAEKRRVAESIFMDWRPDAYEKFYGVVLEEGASRVKDERAFKERHSENFIATSAFGDWHPQVPTGMVVVYASKGGSRAPGTPGAYFLVPGEEYDRKPWAGFVVYGSKHPEFIDFDPYAR